MKRPHIRRVAAAALSLLLGAAFAAPVHAQAPQIEGLFVEPINPGVFDDIELVVVGRQSPECPYVWAPPVYIPAELLYRIETTDPSCDTVASERFEQRFPIGKIPFIETRYAEVRHGGGTLGREAISVYGPTDLAVLVGDRFQVTVEWVNVRDNIKGKGHATELTDESAAFWFFDHKNLEVTVKVLDGRAVNGHWWVFIANMTDLEVKITVLENRDNCLLLPVTPPACPTRIYEQTAGSNRNFLDTQAFPE
jgi:hypothetical protein